MPTETKERVGSYLTAFRSETVRKRVVAPEMEFLDNNLTKDLSLLFRAIRSPFYWRILKKTILFSGFKNLYKKNFAKQENSNSWIAFLERKIRIEH